MITAFPDTGCNWVEAQICSRGLNASVCRNDLTGQRLYGTRQDNSARRNRFSGGLIVEIAPLGSMLAGFKGLSMWWFTKSKRKEIWDEDIQWPIGDIEAAHKIREICRSVADSAEKVGGFAGRPDNEENKHEADRYERAAKTAMEIAIKISDDLLRDAAVRQIVTLCVTANDLRTARILFRAIQAISIREELLNEHPVLRP
jgi:hypothetical protein